MPDTEATGQESVPLDNESTSILPKVLAWYQQAQEVFNQKLHRQSSDEWCGPCPKCGGEDRFIVFVEGNFWCRQCDYKGWWKESISREERTKREQEKLVSQQRLLALIQRCEDWRSYHNYNPECRDYWHNEGFTDREIQTWNLGYCQACPVLSTSPSLTVPVWYKGILYDIRHRLLSPTPDSGKYRSHMTGLIPPFFNLDSIANDRKVYMVEGEKKVIKTVSCGVKAVVGYPGINFMQRLTNMIKQKIPPDQEIIFIPDPGTVKEVVAKLHTFTVPHRISIVELWKKPDDFIREYGQAAFLDCLAIARPV